MHAQWLLDTHISSEIQGTDHILDFLESILARQGFSHIKSTHTTPARTIKAKRDGVKVTMLVSHEAPNDRHSKSAWRLHVKLSKTLFASDFGIREYQKKALQDIQIAIDEHIHTVSLTSYSPQPQHLSVRDQTKLAIFYGRILATDTSDWPELQSDESLTPDQYQRWISSNITWPETEHWGLYRIGYRSAQAPITSIALIYHPSVQGRWWFEEGYADFENAGHIPLDIQAMASFHIPEEHMNECDTLAEIFGDEVLAECAWQVVSLVDLKHT